LALAQLEKKIELIIHCIFITKKMTALPDTFAVHTSMNGREGYAVYCSNLITGTYTLSVGRHDNLYYNIITDITLPLGYNTVQSKKSHGTVTRPMNWAFTREVLKYNGIDGIHGVRRYAIIKIISMSIIVPKFKTYSFIPIVAEPVQPVQIVRPVNLIQVIPQHAVKALLTYAALEEDVCPITSNEIDVSNGAVTSCFHTFEKEALSKWLAMESSRDKCPVCNAKCKMYSIE